MTEESKPAPPVPTFRVEFDEGHEMMTIQIPIKRIAADVSDQMFIFMRGYFVQAEHLAISAVAEKRAEAQASKLITPGKIPLRVQ